MRRPLDELWDVYNGLGGTNPGLYRGQMSARFVEYQYRSMITPPFNEVIGYVNHFSPLVRAGLAVADPPYFKLDPTFGSRLVRTADGFTVHVLWRELIRPRLGTPYFRVYVIP